MPSWLPGLDPNEGQSGQDWIEAFKRQSAASDEFYTPRWLLDALPQPIDLDPCSPPHRPVRAARHVVGVEGGNGLAVPWSGVVFMNPPYSRGNLPRWTAKAAAEVRAGRAQLVIGLVPARPESVYWHANIWQGPAPIVGFIHGRITFDDAYGEPTDDCAKLGSALVFWCLQWGLASAAANYLTGRLRQRTVHLVNTEPTL